MSGATGAQQSLAKIKELSKNNETIEQVYLKKEIYLNLAYPDLYPAWLRFPLDCPSECLTLLSRPNFNKLFNDQLGSILWMKQAAGFLAEEEPEQVWGADFHEFLTRNYQEAQVIIPALTEMASPFKLFRIEERPEQEKAEEREMACQMASDSESISPC